MFVHTGENKQINNYLLQGRCGARVSAGPSVRTLSLSFIADIVLIHVLAVGTRMYLVRTVRTVCARKSRSTLKRAPQ